MRSATFGTEIWIRNQTDRKVKDLTVEINLVGKDNRGNKLDKKMVAPVGTIQAFSETSVTLSGNAPGASTMVCRKTASI